MLFLALDCDAADAWEDRTARAVLAGKEAPTIFDLTVSRGDGSSSLATGDSRGRRRVIRRHFNMSFPNAIVP